jgi:hypothetical protein
LYHDHDDGNRHDDRSGRVDDDPADHHDHLRSNGLDHSLVHYDHRSVHVQRWNRKWKRGRRRRDLE